MAGLIMMRCMRSCQDEDASDLLAQQDADAPQVDETAVVERMTLRAHDQPAQVAEPSKQPFDAPAPPEAPQGTAVGASWAVCDHAGAGRSSRCPAPGAPRRAERRHRR